MAKTNLIPIDAVIGKFLYDPEAGHILLAQSSPEHAHRIGKRVGSLYLDGYRRVSIGRTRILEHRLAWALSHGAWPEDFIDHVNGDRSDNRLINLREASRSENGQNRAKSSNNSSGFTGVSFCKRYNCWQASIQFQRKPKFIGYFETPEFAAAAYAEAKSALHKFNPEVVAR